MAESAVTKTVCDGVLTILDGTGVPLTYEVTWEPGDFTVTLPGKTVNAYKDRNKFGATPQLRYGEEQAITFSFTAQLRDLHDGTDELLASFILDPDGDASSAVGGWVSTLSATAEVKTYTLQWDIEGTDHGDAADHQLVLAFCTLSGSITEGDPSTISIEGTSWQQYPSSMT